MIMSATASGSGSVRGPATREQAYQAAINRASESRRKATLLSRPVEGAAVKRVRLPDQLGAAELGEHAVERARVGLLLVDRAAEDAFAVALAVGRERRRVAHADAGREPLPFGRRGREDFLGRSGGIEEAIDRGFVARRPAAVEGIADDGDWRLGAKVAHHAGDLDGAPEALAFEIGAEVPERKRAVVLALLGLLGQERRCAIDDGRLPAQVEAGAAREPLQEEPAFVERTARDRELFAFEVGD